MKQMVVITLLMAAVLSGCSQVAWETVQDDVSVTPVSSWLDEAHVIQTQLPQQVRLVEQTQNSRLYSAQDGSLEIEMTTMLASDPETAVYMLSGFHMDELNMLETQKFGMEQYQFAWASQTGEGSRLYRACIVMADTECYAIVCSFPETSGDLYQNEIRQVFATFGLSADEGV